MIKEALAKLIKVKTIITLLMTLIFCVLALTGVIGAELFMSIFTVIIGFYFGTQTDKKEAPTQTTE
jgi:hypothetical protein